MRYQDLAEAIALSKVRSLVKNAPPREHNDIFDQFSQYRRNSRDRLYFPLIRAGEQSDAHYENMRKVFKAILEFSPHQTWMMTHMGIDKPVILADDEDCKDTPENRALYIEGYAMLKGQKVRIGKVLAKMDKIYQSVVAISPETMGRHDFGHRIEKKYAVQLLDEHRAITKTFETDPARDLAKSPSGFMVVISRHPYDIAGMSTGRGWTSCVDLNGGGERWSISGYINTGCMVAYMCREDDPNIEHPVARLNLIKLAYAVEQEDISSHRYDVDPSVFILSPTYSDSTHGVNEKSFRSFIEKFCRIVNRYKPDGLYRGMEGQQYRHLKEIKKGNRLYDASMTDSEKWPIY